MSFLKTYKWLLPSLAFTATLIVARACYTGSPTFIFLIWNLFLAVVPLYFSYLLTRARSKTAVWLYAGIWLLFLPNAMYLVTDLFHLKERPGVPLWFDLLVLFSAAVNGLLLGFLSICSVEMHLRHSLRTRHIPTLLFAVCCLCGYGIYLGRYLRLNSWNILTHPLRLLCNVQQDICHPFRNQQCWLLSCLFAVWMYGLYTWFKKLAVA
jgi:uncharacterized membrane protein